MAVDLSQMNSVSLLLDTTLNDTSRSMNATGSSADSISTPQCARPASVGSPTPWTPFLRHPAPRLSTPMHEFSMRRRWAKHLNDSLGSAEGAASMRMPHDVADVGDAQREGLDATPSAECGRAVRTPDRRVRDYFSKQLPAFGPSQLVRHRRGGHIDASCKTHDYYVNLQKTTERRFLKARQQEEWAPLNSECHVARD